MPSTYQHINMDLQGEERLALFANVPVCLVLGSCDAFGVPGKGLKPLNETVISNSFWPFFSWRVTHLTIRCCWGLGDNVSFGLSLFVIEAAFTTRAAISSLPAGTSWELQPQSGVGDPSRNPLIWFRFQIPDTCEPQNEFLPSICTCTVIV